MTMENKDYKEKPTNSPRRKKTVVKEDSNPIVEIEVKRHQQFFELLNDPGRMWRVLLSLFVIIIVLFIGIAFVVVSIKKYYPYSVIENNLQGASIVKSEDKEVIYWLFNTADLWANSGIEVQKGDELTIYASGASFTAIHHLTKASEENSRPQDAWVGTEGQEKRNERDRLRARYRINKDCAEGTLLMQIVNKDSIESLKIKDNCNQELLGGGHVEIIGKGRNNLRISKDGVLHFAVNDIVLTDDVLKDMYFQYIDSLAQNFKNHSRIFEKAKKQFESLQNANDAHSIYLYILNVTLLSGSDSSSIKKYALEKGLSFGEYPRNEGCYPLMNELVYYKQEKFRDAWYMDNLGSFLIVIERKK